MHYEARINSDALPAGRVAILRINKEGTEKGKCSHCNKTIRFDSIKDEDIEQLSCSSKCSHELGFYPAPKKYVSTPKVQNSTSRSEKLSECPDCGGASARGKGFVHTDDCLKNLLVVREKVRRAINKNELVCPYCKGIRFRRGYSHAIDCPAKVGTAAAITVLEKTEPKIRWTESDQKTYEELRAMDPVVADEWKKKKVG